MSKPRKKPTEIVTADTESFAEMIVPRDTLLAMVGSLSSRHGRFDPHVMARMDRVEPSKIPLRIADYAQGIWLLCREIGAEEKITTGDLLQVAVMAASMTTGQEDTAATVRRAIMTLKACDQVICEQEHFGLERAKEIEAEELGRDFFKEGNLKFMAFLRPFFAENSKTADKVARFREYLHSISGSSGEGWVEHTMGRFRKDGVPEGTANAYKRHFAAFLEARKRVEGRRKASKGGLAKQAKADEIKKH